MIRIPMVMFFQSDGSAASLEVPANHKKYKQRTLEDEWSNALRHILPPSAIIARAIRDSTTLP
jgi:hypothetical protein